MELERISITAKVEKKNKSLALKVEKYDSDGDMSLIVNNFERFPRHEKKKT